MGQDSLFVLQIHNIRFSHKQQNKKNPNYIFYLMQLCLLNALLHWTKYSSRVRRSRNNRSPNDSLQMDVDL